MIIRSLPLGRPFRRSLTLLSRLSLLALAAVAMGRNLHAQSFSVAPTRMDSARAMPGPVYPGSAFAPDPALETYQRGHRMVLDWTSSSTGPVRFRVLRPDGRFIAMRMGRRSVQGWIASLRVAGWPEGIYLVEAESGSQRTLSTFLLY